ncbi:unnamed protein product, partial [Sphacelaria rigidula]
KDEIGGYEFPTGPSTAMPPFARGFPFRTWHDGAGGPAPPNALHPYPPGFSPFRYPPLGPQGGYAFSHNNPFFAGGGYPGAPSGYPQQMARSTYPAVFGAGVPYGPAGPGGQGPMRDGNHGEGRGGEAGEGVAGRGGVAEGDGQRSSADEHGRSSSPYGSGRQAPPYLASNGGAGVFPGQVGTAVTAAAVANAAHPTGWWQQQYESWRSSVSNPVAPSVDSGEAPAPTKGEGEVNG